MPVRSMRLIFWKCFLFLSISNNTRILSENPFRIIDTKMKYTNFLFSEPEVDTQQYEQYT